MNEQFHFILKILIKNQTLKFPAVYLKKNDEQSQTNPP
jgi:hypothetical protein